MSRDYIPSADVPEDAAWSLRSIAESLAAIREVLEDWRRPRLIVKAPDGMTEEEAVAWREQWIRDNATEPGK